MCMPLFRLGRLAASVGVVREKFLIDYYICEFLIPCIHSNYYLFTIISLFIMCLGRSPVDGKIVCYSSFVLRCSLSVARSVGM